MKILFITANRVGDAVLTTGLLRWLVDHYPNAQFTIACGPYGAGLFEAVPRLDRIIVMRKRKYNLHWLDLWRTCVPTQWDFIIDMRNSIVSRLLRAKKRAIHHGGNRQHKVIENGLVLGLTPPPDPHIWLSARAIEQARHLVPTGKKILALGPAANWAGKQWPIEHFITLAKTLTTPDGLLSDALIMVLADQHERPQIAELLSAFPDNRRIDIIGQDLQTAAACLQRASLYVGNDSGLMHMAAALGVKTLGLFGPGFPDIYAPWGKNCSWAKTPENRDTLLAGAPDAHGSFMASLTVKNALLQAHKLLSVE